MTEEQSVVVAGAGIMGAGIAYVFAVSGYRILLTDPSEKAREKAVQTIAQALASGVERGKLDSDAAEAARGRVMISDTIDERAGGAMLLVETATENIAIKHSIIQRAVAVMPPDAIIATNTSALSISEIASVSDSADRVIGMHFFNPVPKMKLVEIIRGIETSEDTLRRTIDITRSLNKDFVVVNEAPGFTTSRMSAMMGNEAMYMLAEGVASAEDIDKSLRMAFNHPVGPLELGDMTGWDTRLKVLEYLYEVLGEKFRPCPLIRKMVKSGRHGRKTGKGVYAYDGEGKRIPDSGLKVTL